MCRITARSLRLLSAWRCAALELEDPQIWRRVPYLGSHKIASWKPAVEPFGVDFLASVLGGIVAAARR